MTRSLFPSTVTELLAVYEGEEFGAGPVLKCCEYEIVYELARIYPNHLRLRRLELARKMLEKSARREEWQNHLDRITRQRELNERNERTNTNGISTMLPLGAPMAGDEVSQRQQPRKPLSQNES